MPGRAANSLAHFLNHEPAAEADRAGPVVRRERNGDDAKFRDGFCRRGGPLLAVMPFDPAFAGGGATSSAPGPHCKTGSTVVINKPVNINKPVTISNPVTINNNVSIYKPVTIQKDINVYSPVTINKNIDVQNNIDIQKTIDIQNSVNINKNINIEKSITINNGGTASATATATAIAQALASSQSSASANANGSGSGLGSATTGASSNAQTVYFGSYSEENVVHKGAGGEIGNIATTPACEMQEATVVKAIHAVCVAGDGREFPASHMLTETFIDNSYEGEIARCIPGAHLKLTIGDVVQSDQGLAGTYLHGAQLICSEHEAVRRFQERHAEMRGRNAGQGLRRAHPIAQIRHRRHVLLISHASLRHTGAQRPMHSLWNSPA